MTTPTISNTEGIPPMTEPERLFELLKEKEVDIAQEREGEYDEIAVQIATLPDGTELKLFNYETGENIERQRFEILPVKT